MLPDDLARSGSELAHQVALFAYVAKARLRGFDAADVWAAQEKEEPTKPFDQWVGPEALPELKWFHAIPNGGTRGDDAISRAIRGGQLKAQGVRNGVADTFLPLPRGGYHGLYVEMKRPSLKPKRAGSSGGVSDDQQEFRAYAQSVGYGWVVCYTWREAADILRMYMEQK